MARSKSKKTEPVNEVGMSSNSSATTCKPQNESGSRPLHMKGMMSEHNAATRSDHDIAMLDEDETSPPDFIGLP